MEIGGDTLEGHWANDSQSGRDFFIITDAEFTKLCVLGDDVEPCFEGADIKAANNFSLVEESDDNNFKAQLLKMVEDLKFALEGGNNMDKDTAVTPIPVEASVTPVEPEAPVATPVEPVEPETESALEGVETPAEPAEPETDDFAKGKEEDSNGEGEAEGEKPEDDEDGKKEPKKENALEGETPADPAPSVEQDYTELQSKFELLSAEHTKLQEEYAKLKNFYDTEMNKQKDELINKFYMLSDEDKKDVLEHKSEYSLEDIEAKLSVICFRKKVNFNLAEEEKNDNTMIDNGTTFTLTMDAAVNALESDVPAWVKAIEDMKNKD